MENRKLILDTETTGLDVDSGDRIVEIGILELIDNVKTGSMFHSYINPERKVGSDAKKIHRLDNNFLKNQPCFLEIIDDLNDYIKDSILVIHNAQFDKKFLDFEFENCGYKPLNNKIIDTISIARQEFPGQSISLDSLCRKLKIDNSHRNYHGALIDSDLLSLVYLGLTTGKQDSFSLDKSSSNLLTNKSEFRIKNIDREKYPDRSKHFNYPKDELLAHKKFIQKIKNSIWEQSKSKN